MQFVFYEDKTLQDFFENDDELYRNIERVDSLIKKIQISSICKDILNYLEIRKMMNWNLLHFEYNCVFSKNLECDEMSWNFKIVNPKTENEGNMKVSLFQNISICDYYEDHYQITLDHLDEVLYL